MSLFSGLFSNQHATGQLDAINRSQARIEFDLEGKVLDANENFLSVMGYTPVSYTHLTLPTTPYV